MKPPQGFTVLEHPPWSGWRRAEDPEDAVLAALRSPEDALLKDDPASRVWLVEPWVVKRFEPRSGWLSRGRSRRARKALIGAVELTRRGIATPCPIAALTRSDQPGRSWLITAAAAGRPLEEALAEDGGLGQELLAWVAELHEGGLYHGDLKRANVFAELADPARFSLIDLDDLRLAPLRPLRAAARDLGMLLSSVGGFASQHERLRAFARYRKRRGWPPGLARRALARAADFARRRAARGGKPSCGGWPP